MKKTIKAWAVMGKRNKRPWGSEIGAYTLYAKKVAVNKNWICIPVTVTYDIPKSKKS